MKSLTDKVDYKIWDKVGQQVYGGQVGSQIVMKVDLRLGQNFRDQVWQQVSRHIRRYRWQVSGANQ